MDLRLGNNVITKAYIGNTLVTDVLLGESSPSIPNLIAYYRFEDNVNDQLGLNNGIGTNVTYNASGKLDKSIVFSGSNSYVKITDSDTFSFTDGLTDTPFSVTFSFKFNTVNRCWMVSKRNGGASNYEYDILNNTGNKFTLILWDNSNGSFLLKEFTWSPVVSAWNNLAVTYDGSGLVSGMSLYINAVSGGSTSTSGTYTRMRNSSSGVQISGIDNNSFNVTGEMDELRFWDKELSQLEIDNLNI